MPKLIFNLKSSWAVDLFLILLILLLSRLFLFGLIFDLPGTLVGDDIYYIQNSFLIKSEGLQAASNFRSSGTSVYYSLIPQALNPILTLRYVLILNSITTAITSTCLYLVLRNVNRIVAFLSALLFAVLPGIAVLNGRALSETPTALFLSVFFVALVSKGNHTLRTILLILSSFLLTWTREIFILMPPLFFAFSYLFDEKRRARWLNLWNMSKKMSFIIATSYLLMILVLCQYNSSNGKGFRLSDGTFGFNLWVGSWEHRQQYMYGTDLKLAEIPDHAFLNSESRVRLREVDASYYDKEFLNLALQSYQVRPLFVLKNWLSRVPYFFGGTRSEYIPMQVNATSYYYFIKSSLWLINSVFMVSGLLGILTARDMLPPRVNVAAGLILLYVSAIYVPFHNSESRYSAPLLPLFCVYSACFIARGCSLLNAKYRRID